ncbi:hypothetical protein BDZ97DRAFT_718247 [Flammula alnicola]|nr:hypothetical protein BDZ97DRAFT_718247 [Flammula alnicola]
MSRLLQLTCNILCCKSFSFSYFKIHEWQDKTHCRYRLQPMRLGFYCWPWRVFCIFDQHTFLELHANLLLFSQRLDEQDNKRKLHFHQTHYLSFASTCVGPICRKAGDGRARNSGEMPVRDEMLQVFIYRILELKVETIRGTFAMDQTKRNSRCPTRQSIRVPWIPPIIRIARS